MDKPRLNLNDLVPLWEREFHDRMRKSVLDGDFGNDMNVLKSASIQDLVGQPGTLSQDAFGSFVVRQRRV